MEQAAAVAAACFDCRENLQKSPGCLAVQASDGQLMGRLFEKGDNPYAYPKSKDWRKYQPAGESAYRAAFSVPARLFASCRALLREIVRLLTKSPALFVAASIAWILALCSAARESTRA